MAVVDGLTRTTRRSVGSALRVVTEGSFVVVLLGLVAFYAFSPISCTDFFWHLTLGDIIRQTGSIPREDLFSAVHPGRSYVQPAWLWEWLYAALHARFGLMGVRVAQVALLTTTFAGLYVLSRRWLGGASTAALVAAATLSLFEDRFRPRPDAWTLTFLVLSLPLLVPASLTGSVRRAVYAFALGILWSNVHGGTSVLLLLSLGALAVGSAVEQQLAGRDMSGARAHFACLLAAILGVLASPTTVPGLMHWASLIGAQLETGNEEWLPTYQILRTGITPSTLWIAVAPSLVALVYLGVQRWRVKGLERAAYPVSEWLLCGGYLVLSQHAVRNVGLCVVPLLFLLRDVRSARVTWMLPAGLSLAMLAITFDDVVLRGYGGAQRAVEIASRDQLLPNAFPVEAADFLDEAGIEGGILNHGMWGGYLIHRCWPRCHVFVDSRQNMTAEMWRVYMATLSMQTRVPAVDFAMTKWGVELLVMKGPVFPLIRPTPDWQLLYKAGDQEVYQHIRGAHAEQNLARTRRYLTVHGADAREPLYEAAARIGAQAWLSDPYQARRLSQALSESRQADARAAALGFERLGEIYYQAGEHARALAAFGEARARGVVGTRLLYLDALCSVAVGEVSRARERLAELATRDAGALSMRQRERLELMRAVLPAPAANRTP